MVFASQSVRTGTPRQPLGRAERGGKRSSRDHALGSVLLDFLDFGVNDVVVSGCCTGRGACCTGRGGGCCLGAAGCLRIGVHLLAELLAGRHQRRGLGVDGVLVLALESLFQVLDGALDGDRKSTRLNSSPQSNLVCRLLLEKKKNKLTLSS